MKRTFYTLIFLVLINSNMGYAGQQQDGFVVACFKWLAKPFVRYGAGQQAIKDMDNVKECLLNNPDLKAVAESSQNIAETNNAIAESANQIAQNIKAQTECAVKITAACEKVASGIQLATNVVGAIAVLKFSAEVAQGTKEYFRPGHEQQLKTATIKMHKCLFDFKNTPKDQTNLPIGCRKQLDTFERIAGPAALNNLRDVCSK